MKPKMPNPKIPKAKMLFSWKEVREIDREGLENAYMRLYSAYITASADRYRRSKGIAKDLLKKEHLSEQKNALLQVIDYYNNFIDFRELDYLPKRIVWNFITCFDVWDNKELIPPIERTPKLYKGAMDSLEVNLLKKEEADFIYQILIGEKTIDRTWKEWEDKIVLPINEDLLRDEKSEMKYRAYQVGRTVEDVREHFKNGS